MPYAKQEVKAGDIMDPDWGNHIQTQYEEAKQDAKTEMLDRFEGKQETLTFTNQVSQNMNVVFSKPFASPPIVVATGGGSSAIVATASSITNTGFLLQLRHSDNTNFNGNFYANWIAFGTR